jgi:nucleoside-diphosphate-sugar epimerase
VIGDLLRGREAACSPGRQRRDFLFVDDVARALALLVAAEVEGCVNVASGEAVTIASLALAIGKAIGRPERVRLGARPGAEEEAALVEGDPTRLRDAVGFEPAWSLERGLQESIRWWRDQLAAPAEGFHGEGGDRRAPS